MYPERRHRRTALTPDEAARAVRSGKHRNVRGVGGEGSLKELLEVYGHGTRVERAYDLEKLRAEFDQLRERFYGFVNHVNTRLERLERADERIDALERTPQPSTPPESPDKG